MSLSWRLWTLPLALSIGLAAAVANVPAEAVETPPGTTNFTPPAYVPNYFSNESGPFQGGASARDAGVGPSLAAPAPRGRGAVLSHRVDRHHPGRAAKAAGRGRLAHDRAVAHRQFAHAVAVHGARASGARTAHAQVGHATGKAVAAKTPAAGKGKHITAAHG
jgi:hypothetical protein